MIIWAASLAALTVLRLLVAATAPLAPDEAYYRIWSHALAFGYLDHPPMVAAWIRVGTLIAGDTPLGIRLLGPISAALGSVLLVDATNQLLPGRRAGVAAAALLNATLMFGVGSVLMTPDTPLLFFWTATLWAAVRAARSDSLRWWCIAGVSAGLALASKYTAAFLWIGVAIWLLWVPSLRRCLRQPGPWVGALLGGLVFLPVILLWNADHGWAGIMRQGGRVSDWQPTRAFGFLSELIGGQIGLATPLIFALCLIGMVRATRTAWRERDAGATFVAAMTLPPVLVFLQHALGDRVQGNWPGIVYPTACIAAAGFRNLRARWEQTSVVLGLALTGLVYVQSTTSVFPFPPKRDPIALQLSGWPQLAAEVQVAARDAGASFIAVHQYALASELAYQLPASTPVIGVDKRWSLIALPRPALEGQVGLLVEEGSGPALVDPAQWREVTPVGNAARESVKTFRLYRVVPAGPMFDAAILPGRTR